MYSNGNQEYWNKLVEYWNGLQYYSGLIELMLRVRVLKRNV